MSMFLKRGWAPVLIIVALVLGVFLMTTYNGLVAKDEMVRKNFAELQATYQRRLDLLPNLVATVKANSEYEKTVQQEVAEARALAMQVTVNASADGSKFSELEATQSQLANTANRLIAVIENYPDLKTTEAFSKLQTQIEGTERRINLARKDFNEAVKEYNNSVRSVPTNLVAGMLGFKIKEGFQADAGAAQAPEIKF